VLTPWNGSEHAGRDADRLRRPMAQQPRQPSDARADPEAGLDHDQAHEPAPRHKRYLRRQGRPRDLHRQNVRVRPPSVYETGLPTVAGRPH
jgi:hypothetical protein